MCTGVCAYESTCELRGHNYPVTNKAPPKSEECPDWGRMRRPFQPRLEAVVLIDQLINLEGRQM